MDKILINQDCDTVYPINDKTYDFDLDEKNLKIYDSVMVKYGTDVFECIESDKLAYNYVKKIKEIKKSMNNIKYIEDYLKNNTHKYAEIVMNQNILNNMPTVNGTRIPVSLILACLRDEITIDDICDTYNITQNQVIQALDYVIEVLDKPFQGE